MIILITFNTSITNVGVSTHVLHSHFQCIFLVRGSNFTPSLCLIFVNSAVDVQEEEAAVAGCFPFNKFTMGKLPKLSGEEDELAVGRSLTLSCSHLYCTKWNLRLFAKTTWSRLDYVSTILARAFLWSFWHRACLAYGSCLLNFWHCQSLAIYEVLEDTSESPMTMVNWFSHCVWCLVCLVQKGQNHQTSYTHPQASLAVAWASTQEEGMQLNCSVGVMMISTWLSSSSVVIPCYIHVSWLVTLFMDSNLVTFTSSLSTICVYLTLTVCITYFHIYSLSCSYLFVLLITSALLSYCYHMKLR